MSDAVQVASDLDVDETKRVMVESARGLLDYEFFVKRVLSHEYKEFHREAMQVRERVQGILKMPDGTEILIDMWLAPRGHGKTTVGTTDHITHAIVEDPNIRIILASNTATQAEDMGAEIRQNLESDAIISRYGVQKPEAGSVSMKWTAGALNVNDRTRIGKENTLACMGWAGPIISKHNELAYLDDVVDEDVASSETLRKKQKTWFFKEFLPCIEPGGKLHIVGTRYHPLDLYQVIMEQMENVVVTIHKAIGDDGTALWPARFPLKVLEQKRRESGSIIFNMQYQNDVGLARGQIFKPDYFGYHNGIPDNVTPIMVVESVDPQIVEKESGDFFVNVACAVVLTNDGFKLYFLPDMVRSRPDFEGKAKLCVQLHQQRVNMFHGTPVRMVIETVAAQHFLLERIQKLAKERGISIHATGFTPHRDKVARAWEVTPYFENRTVSFPTHCPTATEIVEEMQLFPDAEHDDGTDAVCMAVKTAASYYRQHLLAHPPQEPQYGVGTVEWLDRLIKVKGA